MESFAQKVIELNETLHQFYYKAKTRLVLTAKNEEDFNCADTCWRCGNNANV